MELWVHTIYIVKAKLNKSKIGAWLQFHSQTTASHENTLLASDKLNLLLPNV